MIKISLLFLPILIPFIASIIIKALGGNKKLRELTIIVAPFVTLLSVIKLYSLDYGVKLALFEIMPNLEIAFSIEPLGLLFATIISVLWIIASLYSIGYMNAHKEPRQDNFFFFFTIAITIAIATSLADNLFTLFIFYELLTISTYPLVTHKADPESKKSGRIYLIILLGSSLLLFLPALIYTYYLTNDLTFISGGIFTDAYANGDIGNLGIGLLLALFIFGVAKAAIMPLHSWLPAAMVAPTPVSALLHAVAVVKVGVFTIIKIIIYIFGTELLFKTSSTEWLIYLSGFTIITASIIALKQDNLKRLLAYSTISQLSYIIIGVAMINSSAIVGSILHLTAHATSKITLFFAAGIIYTSTGFTRISQMRGIGHKMKLTMICFTVGSLSMIGIPMFGGFVSKWYIVSGALSISNWFVISVITISTLLNTAYFIPIIYKSFSQGQSSVSYKKVPNSMLLATIASACLTVIIFLFPEFFIEVAKNVI